MELNFFFPKSKEKSNTPRLNQDRKLATTFFFFLYFQFFVFRALILFNYYLIIVNFDQHRSEALMEN
jgi:hypothetical protein